MMKSITSGENILWGVTEDGCLWYRANIGPGTPMGSHWYKMEDGLDMGWRMVTVMKDLMWGIDTKEMLMARNNVCLENIKGIILIFTALTLFIVSLFIYCQALSKELTL